MTGSDKKDPPGLARVIPIAPRRRAKLAAVKKTSRRKNREGSLVWVPGKGGAQGHYKARISLPNGGGRPWLHFEPGLTEERAKEKAASQTGKAWKHGATYTPKRDRNAPASLTVSGLFDAWLDIVAVDPELAPASVYNHRTNAKQLKKALGNYRVEELTTGVLRRWIRELRVDHGRSPSRIRNVYNTLAGMLDCAIGEEWLPAEMMNPCRHPKVRSELPTIEAPDAIRFHTEQEARVLIESDQTPEERSLRYLVAFTSGMRDGEIAMLRWSNVRDEGGVLVYDVRRSLSKIGPEGFATTEGRTKTKSSRRLIPVHSAAELALAAWKAKGWLRRVGRLPTESDPIFPSQTGGFWRPLSAEFFRDDLECAGLATSFRDTGEPFEFRDLRHTFSTWLASAGVAEDLRDRLMGHAPRTIGLRHYTAGDLGQLQAAVEKIYLSPKLSQDDVDFRKAVNGQEVPMGGKGITRFASAEEQRSDSAEKREVKEETTPSTNFAKSTGDSSQDSLLRALDLAIEAKNLDLCAQIVAEMRARRIGGGK